MLLIAELYRPEKGEYQRVLLSCIGATRRTFHRLLIYRQRGVACFGKRGRIDFYLARGGAEALRLASLRINLSILLISG